MIKQTELEDFMRLLKNEKQCSSCGKWVQRDTTFNSLCEPCLFNHNLDVVWNETPQYTFGIDQPASGVAGNER